MKKNLPCLILLLVLLFSFSEIKSQWCVPTTAIPYDANMPGLTHVLLNTIDRTSAALENYPNNSYVYTGLSTDLVKGATYSISLTYTIDATICPTMNLRVWIDFNQDGQLDDVGETVVSVNNRLPGTYTASFTIPATATSGLTRMRVTAKMSQSGGHTLPNPCDNPTDPLGYHGEIEDYDIHILDATGISSIISADDFIVSNAANGFNYSISLSENAIAQLQIYDSQGKVVKELFRGQNLSSGNHSYQSTGLPEGIYFAEFTFNNRRIVQKIFSHSVN